MEPLFQAGEVVAGKYRVERVLGRGGMGVVLAATHVQLEQPVALKFLLDEGATDGVAVSRFLREARAAVKLRGEHVAKVLDVGTLDSGAPYIVMEYLEGQDLGAVIEAGALPIEEAIDYVLQACEGLAEAHVVGIVHRDLKPDNLFLTRRSDGSVCVKILDFGISKMSDKGTPATQTSALMGTPMYMSPEQLRSSKKVDARSDIWALGMILYQLLTGQTAFMRETLPELCAAILMDPLVPPRQLRPSLPEALDRAICVCLEKEPHLRYPSLAELAEALAPFVPGGDASARRISRTLGASAESPARLSLPGAPPSAVTSPAAVAATAVLPSPARTASPSQETLQQLSVEPGRPSASASPSRSRLLLLVPVALAALAGLGFVVRPQPTAPPAPSQSVAIAPAPASSQPTPQPLATVIVEPAPSATATASASATASATQTAGPQNPRKPPPPPPPTRTTTKPGGGTPDFGGRQ